MQLLSLGEANSFRQPSVAKQAEEGRWGPSRATFSSSDESCTSLFSWGFVLNVLWAGWVPLPAPDALNALEHTGVVAQASSAPPPPKCMLDIQIEKPR